MSRSLNDLGGRFLIGHKGDIPWIAKLAWKLGDSSARDAHEVNLRELGFANVSWVRRCPSTIFADMGFLQFDRIAQMSGLTGSFTARLADMSLLLHHLFLSYGILRYTKNSCQARSWTEETIVAQLQPESLFDPNRSKYSIGLSANAVNNTKRLL